MAHGTMVGVRVRVINHTGMREANMGSGSILYNSLLERTNQDPTRTTSLLPRAIPLIMAHLVKVLLPPNITTLKTRLSAHESCPDHCTQTGGVSIGKTELQFQKVLLFFSSILQFSRQGCVGSCAPMIFLLILVFSDLLWENIILYKCFMVSELLGLTI